MQPYTQNELEEQLTRIFADPLFSRASNLRRLLLHITARRSAGFRSPEDYKGDLLSTEVFGRSSSIGKVVARDVRARLTLYYQQAGVTDPIRISIPLGGYCPEITRIAQKTVHLQGAIGHLQAVAQSVPSVLPMLDELSTLVGSHNHA